MGVFSFLRREKRSMHPSNEKLALFFKPNLRDVSTPHVNEDLAKTVSAFYNGLTQLSWGVAKLPLHVYHEKDGVKKRDRKHPLAKVMQRAPNPYMIPFELKEMIVGHLILRGDFFAQIVALKNGSYWLIPLHPDRVRVEQSKDYGLIYHYTDSKGTMVLPHWEVWHVKGAFSDGIRGQSVISAAAASLGRMVAMEDYASAYFSGSSIPSGILTYDGEIEDEQIDQLRAQWRRQMEKKNAEDRVAVLGADLKWQQVGISMEDSQFLESRKFEITEIARWLNLPPHKLKELSNATFSNIEQQKLEFDQDSLLPLTIRVQESATKAFFERDIEERWVEFKFDSLLSTDTATRYAAHNTAIQGGWKTRNEVRAIENLEPIDGLDNILVPLNMAGEADLEGEATPEEEEGQRDWIEPFRPVLNATFERILNRESKRIYALRSKKDPKSEYRAGFQKELDYIMSQLEPVCTGILHYEVPNSRGSVEKFLPKCLSELHEEVRNMLEIGLQQTGDAVFRTVSDGIKGPDYLNITVDRFISQFKSYFFIKVAE